MENSLTMPINFMSCQDSQETRTMHTKSHNVEIMMGNETDDIIKDLFESLLQRYQEGLEEKMRQSEFIFEFYPPLFKLKRRWIKCRF